MIFDEYHFGAWRDNAKKIFEMDNEDEDYDFDNCVGTVLGRWSSQPINCFFDCEGFIGKLKKSEVDPNMACIRETLELTDDVPLLPFSAEKGTGRDALVSAILKAVE